MALTLLSWTPDSFIFVLIYFFFQRREYSKLLGEDAGPVEVVKLFLLGDVAAGKTTMKKSLRGVSVDTLEEKQLMMMMMTMMYSYITVYITPHNG